MRKQKGFTLIELVVVVMILGILAAVAAPKLLNTSSTAADNGLKQTLGVMRDAIERYAAEHSGSLPGGTNAAMQDNLITTGHYLRGTDIPNSPVAGTNTIKPVSASAPLTPDGTTAWMYSTSDGTFICNSADASKSDPSITYDKF